MLFNNKYTIHTEYIYSEAKVGSPVNYGFN